MRHYGVPDLLIDWLAKACSLVVPLEINSTLRRPKWSVMSRRDDSSTSFVLFSCILLIAFVSQASHHQYIEFPMDWTEFFPLQDCTLCTYILRTYNTKDTISWRGVTMSFYPLYLFLRLCIFFLFGLQASLSAERALSAFHFLLHRLF